MENFPDTDEQNMYIFMIKKIFKLKFYFQYHLSIRSYRN